MTNASASVNVSLQDAISHKLVAKGRYTEQAPHTIRARASAYLTTAASAARSAVHRLQAVAESALQRADSTTGSQSNQAGSDQSQDIKHKAMASLANAGATVRAAAHRLQVAADSVLHSSSADLQHGQTDTADNNIESTEGGDEVGAGHGCHSHIVYISVFVPFCKGCQIASGTKHPQLQETLQICILATVLSRSRRIFH